MSMPANSNEGSHRFAVDRGNGKPWEKHATRAEAVAARDLLRSVGYTQATIYTFNATYGTWLPDRYRR